VYYTPGPMKAPKARSTSEAAAGRSRSPLLLLTVFLTGLVALAGWSVWLRKLALLFGSTAGVLATALALFLLGLALGALAGGRAADRSERPWRRLALLEIGLGAYVLLSLMVLDLGHRLFLAILATIPGDPTPLAAALLRVPVLLAVTIVPAFLTGAVFPLAVRLGRSPATVGRDLARVYGLGALGGAAGALLAGFSLIPELGLAAASWLLGSAAVGLGLVILSAKSRETRRVAPEAAAESAAAPAAGAGALGALLVTLPVGAAALLLAAGWSRFFALLSGTQISSTLAVAAAGLAGIGAGSLLMGRFVDRIRDPFAAIAYLYGAVAVGGMLVFRSEGAFTRSYFALFHRTAGFEAFQLAAGLVVLLIVAPAALILGASLPLVARTALRGGARETAELGIWAGRSFFAFALGAALGALGGRLVLLPVWGFEGLMVATLAVYVAATMVFLALSPSPRRWLHTAACAILLAVALVLSPALMPFEMPRESLSYHGLRAGGLAAYARESRSLTPVDRRQGLYGEVDVARVGANLVLKVDGKTAAGTSLAESRTAVLLGHLPLLFHPHPRRVLLLGLGGGFPLRAAVHHPEPERITVAEADPLIVEAARGWFAPANGHALDDPRVRVVAADGRGFLDTSRQRFDVVIAASPSPWTAGAAGLFTLEHYRAVAAHLTANGIFGQAVPLDEMKREDFRTWLHTITTVFPNVTFWQSGSNVILLASPQPFLIELEPTVARLRSSALAQDFTALGLSMRGVVDLLNSPAVRPDQVAAFLGNVEAVNTDDRPGLELATARNLFELAKRNRAGDEQNRSMK
jgi:spermidine synthase